MSDPIEVSVTYLEMHAPPAPRADAPEGVQVEHVECPAIDVYRNLYNTVGATYGWIDRRKMSDEKLIRIVQDPRVEVYVMYVANEPAGYAELDRRRDGEIELAYFGLFPSFIGKKLGSFLLNWTIQRAWSHGPSRVWVHTCSLDHPNAIHVYKRAGFEPYKVEHAMMDDPRNLIESGKV